MKITEYVNEKMGASVRVVDLDGNPWLLAKEVCDYLEIGNSRQAVARLDEDDKNSVTINDGIAGNPNKTVISEGGFYQLVFTSRKPEAKDFKKWVTSEVLPSIRKTGAYAVGEHPIAETLRVLEQLGVRVGSFKSYNQKTTTVTFYPYRQTRAEADRLALEAKRAEEQAELGALYDALVGALPGFSAACTKILRRMREVAPAGLGRFDSPERLGRALTKLGIPRKIVRGVTIYTVPQA